MLNYQELVKPGDHMVLLYDDENAVVKPVVNFIIASLDRNERCLYVSGDTNMDLLNKTLNEFIDVNECIDKGNLVLLTKEEAYSKDGKFEPDKMIELLIKLTRESLNLGYSGMSITGELSWVLEYGDGIDRIIEYEWKLNEKVFVKESITALCRYNLNKFNDEMIANIIQLHPIIVYKEKLHENPYYLPPEGFKEENLYKYQVETWLKNIDEFTNVKSKFDNEIKQMENENIAKSVFLSKVSHDMKTPLSVIVSLSEFGFGEIDTNKINEYFGEIKESAEYLLSLMNDILDYQTIKNGTVEIERNNVDINLFLKSIFNMIKLHAGIKNLTLETEFNINNQSEISYIMDKKRVSQVLINVLNNAVKYTHPGGRILWKTKIQCVCDECYLINSIEDTGVGMSKRFQRHMFEGFAQEKNALTCSEGGSGLGLSIVKELVELMSGVIEISSELDIGTKVYIKIPLFKADKESINSEEIPNLENKKILICEDNHINSKILIKHLEKTKALIALAENGSEAVEKIKENYYDIVFMDFRMPVMDGSEATKEIRKFYKDVPIIIISAEHEINIKEADCLLSKPIDKDMMYETIKRLI